MLKEFKTFSILLLLWGCSLSLHAEEIASAVEMKSDSEPVAEPEGAGEVQIDLAYIIDRIQSESPRVLFEKESVKRALEVSYQQRAALLPQISLFADQNRQQLGRGFGGTTSSSPPYNSFSAGIQGSMNLLDTQVYADARVARLGHLISQLNYDVAYQDILNEAVTLYFTVLRDLRRVEIYQGNIERDTELLELAKDQYELGVALKLDVTRAMVRVATQKRELMDAEIMLKDSIYYLKALLDLDLDTDVVVDRSIVEDIHPPESILPLGDVTRLNELRPELEAQTKQLRQAELAAKAASWQRLPSLNLYGSFGYESETALDGDEQEAWLVGIEASVPLFEGGRIAAEKREAKAAVRQNQYLMRELRLDIERQFKYAVLQMESRYAQIEIARDEVQLGQDEISQAEERYREGMADNRELIDAQQNLADAQQSLLQAIYLYGISRLEYARAIGQVERVNE